LGFFDFWQHKELEGTITLLSLLINNGESRVAIKCAQMLLSQALSPKNIGEIRFLYASALYEIDRYTEAEIELRKVANKDIRAQEFLADIKNARGEYQQAVKLYGALDQIVNENDHEMRALILHGIGYALGRLGQHNEALQKLQTAKQIFSDLGDEAGLAETVGDIGQILGEIGRFEEAREYLKFNLEICLRTGFLAGIGIAEGLQGEIDLRENKLADAEKRLSKALDIAQRIGNQWREAWTLERLAWLRQLQGKYDEQVSYYDRSKAIFHVIGVYRTQKTHI
jgi:tetratricopeptide (TPR) repeat protein